MAKLLEIRYNDDIFFTAYYLSTRNEMMELLRVNPRRKSERITRDPWAAFVVWDPEIAVRTWSYICAIVAV